MGATPRDPPASAGQKLTNIYKWLTNWGLRHHPRQRGRGSCQPATPAPASQPKKQYRRGVPEAPAAPARGVERRVGAPARPSDRALARVRRRRATAPSGGIFASCERTLAPSAGAPPEARGRGERARGKKTESGAGGWARRGEECERGYRVGYGAGAGGGWVGARAGELGWQGRSAAGKAVARHEQRLCEPLARGQPA